MEWHKTVNNGDKEITLLRKKTGYLPILIDINFVQKLTGQS